MTPNKDTDKDNPVWWVFLAVPVLVALVLWSLHQTETHVAQAEHGSTIERSN